MYICKCADPCLRAVSVGRQKNSVSALRYVDKCRGEYLIVAP